MPTKKIPPSAPVETQPFLTPFDLYLHSQGTNERSYRKLGAHLINQNGVAGCHFAVWAPNAKKISVTGDFNDWDSSANPLVSSDNGVWTTFVPGVAEYALYKFRVIGPNGEVFDKSDPYGFAMEQRPKTGSVVSNLGKYTWNDADWIERRSENQSLDGPIAIYEVHAGSWRKKPDPEWGTRYLTYRELAEELIPYVLEMGYTHIELLPIAEHPLDASWGYQVLGFYAPTSRFGDPQDLMYFVDQCHQHGIGVLLDWVPAHFPRDGAGLNYFDGTHLYEHADPRQGSHEDWGTLVFNYSRNEVRSFLLSNAVFWLDQYHFDGLRVDAVASMLYLDYSRDEGGWVANEFGGRENIAAISLLRKVNEVTHGLFPGTLMIAEESTAWPMVSRPTYMGGLGFSLKWNMGWMHDTLSFMTKNPVYRRYHHNNMTFGMLYAFTENFVLPLSHDEVVHGKGSLLNKMPGDRWQKFANLRAYLGFMMAHPGKKLLFMGGEFGQWQEWTEAKSLEWDALNDPSHQGLRKFVQDANHLYSATPALYEEDFEPSGFRWIDASDTDNSVFCFMRMAHDKTDFIVAISNFTPVPRKNYRVGSPIAGSYHEVLNSDSTYYWGSNVGNEGLRVSEPIPAHGYPNSLCLTLPPLSTLIFQPLRK